MIYCDAIAPDGRELHFDDVLVPGQIVHDEDGRHYEVGQDRGDELPLLIPARTCPNDCLLNTRQTIYGPTMVAGAPCPVCGGSGYVADAKNQKDLP